MPKEKLQIFRHHAIFKARAGCTFRSLGGIHLVSVCIHICLIQNITYLLVQSYQHLYFRELDSTATREYQGSLYRAKLQRTRHCVARLKGTQFFFEFCLFF